MKARIEELERQLAEAELDLRRHREIVESTTDGIVRVDADARITFSNRRFCEMLGYSEDELVGRSIFSVMDAESETLARETRHSRIQGLRNVIDVIFRSKSDRDVAVSMAGAPVFDERNEYVGALALVRDVSEQKTIAARLTISDRLASVGTLAAGVAHEINNPLAIVMANLNHLATLLSESGVAPGSERDDIREPLEDAIEAAERVRVIVRDLMLFSRSSTSTKPSGVDVRLVLQASVRLLANEIRPRACVVESYGDVPPVVADEARLGQVFLNLLLNAAQAIPAGRSQENQISVTTRLEGARVIVDVRDTGEGIPPAILGRIFDAFYTTKPLGVGTGLGLAVSHRIVTGLGGDLTVESAHGNGTTFTISLPVAGGEEATDGSS